MPDRGTVTQERIVYSETFNMTGADKRVGKGAIAYTVTASVNANESGNANFPDDRKCHFNPVSRELKRTIVVTYPNEAALELARKTVALTLGPSMDNCNIHMIDTDEFTPFVAA